MNRLEELIEEISVDKEILNTLPQNNKKNIKVYLEKINELSEKYKSYENDLLNEIRLRTKKFDNIKSSEELKKLNEELGNLESVLYLLNEVDSSYEKMDLDREISNLTYYYKKNLEKVNETIMYCIKKFEEVGIKLTVEDFFFNKYVNEYMICIFNGLESNGINKNKINNKFEEIYWKCPEIITYIEINIRYIYLKNEKIIDKYYKTQKEKLIKKFSQKTLKETYDDIKKTTLEATKRDKYLLIKNFLNGDLIAKDYTREAILDIVYRFTGRNEYSEQELTEVIINLIKLQNTIIEYKNYNKFKFIIDDVKKIYAEKDKYKGGYAKLKKEISQKEIKMIKLGKPKLFKKSNDKNLAEQTKLVLEIKNMYKELDMSEMYDKVASILNNHSSLYEALYLANSFYKYLFNCIITKEKDIEEQEIYKLINELDVFLNWPYFTILNNIEISEEKDIMYIIKDRYNLLNINISKEDLEFENLDSLINLLSKCELYYYIRENNIDVQEISEICEFKKILKNI